MDSLFSPFFLIFLCATACVVESTELDSSAGLKYYIIVGTILCILLGIVLISLYVLCYCCRIQKLKDDVTEVKAPVSRQSTRPKHAVIPSMAPQGNFWKRNQDAGPLPYKKKPRLLNREESSF